MWKIAAVVYFVLMAVALGIWMLAHQRIIDDEITLTEERRRMLIDAEQEQKRYA